MATNDFLLDELRYLRERSDKQVESIIELRTNVADIEKTCVNIQAQIHQDVLLGRRRSGRWRSRSSYLPGPHESGRVGRSRPRTTASRHRLRSVPRCVLHSVSLQSSCSLKQSACCSRNHNGLVVPQ